ncbi:MAG: DUF3332 family protein [Planctomycetota bacterium]
MKRALLLLGLAALPLMTSCIAGPKRLSRSWDVYVNQKYVDDAWIHGALLQNIIPVYPIVGGVAALGDVLVLNPYYFWSRDAWERNGTGFDYIDPEGAANMVGVWPSEEAVMD